MLIGATTMGRAVSCPFESFPFFHRLPQRIAIFSYSYHKFGLNFEFGFSFKVPNFSFFSSYAPLPGLVFRVTWSPYPLM